MSASLHGWRHLVNTYRVKAWCSWLERWCVCGLHAAGLIRPFSALLSQRRQDVFLHSFWVPCSCHSRTLLQATLAPSLVVPLSKSVFCDFSVFSTVMPGSPTPFNLVRNSVVHTPSSVIRDPRYGNVSTCSNCSFRMIMRHFMHPSLAITLILSTVMSRPGLP